MTLAAFRRARKACSYVRTDPTFLFPSPPRPPNSPFKVTKHGDSTTQDREYVSDGYTAQGCDGG